MAKRQSSRVDGDNGLSSAGHRLGQIVGDWWENYVVLPLLQETAAQLDLFLDNRTIERTCRGANIHWQDTYNNIVDYDYVLELDGTSSKKGIPVAFLESFWRRGGRHSKDKARDDTNKLLPMKDTYPTARFLAIAACGEFTEPAREYVRTRGVELLFVPKSNIVKAFECEGLEIDYPDTLPESQKAVIANNLDRKFDEAAKKRVAEALTKIVGEVSFKGFKSRIIGSLTALPQEIHIIAVRQSEEVVFRTIDEASDFLKQKAPSFNFNTVAEEYIYKVSYSDGTEFSRMVNSYTALKALHSSLSRLVQHMVALSKQVDKKLA